MFDGSIGAGSVYMPYGGRYQLTETQTMVAKLPVSEGKMRYRYHDEHTALIHICLPGAHIMEHAYAVLESVARIVAAGGDLQQDPFYFPGILP